MKEGYVEATMSDDKALEDCTVKELREHAKEIGTISGYSSMKKEELIAAIQSAEPVVEAAAPEAEAEVPENPDETAVAKSEEAEAVTEAPEETEPAKAPPAKKESPKKAKEAEAKIVTVKELKDMIELLKKQKEDVTASGGKKERDRIRKKINRLKKQTRKIAGEKAK